MSKCRCGHDHTGQEEVNEEKLISKLAQELADEIDREIIKEIEEMLSQASPSRIPPNPKQEGK